MTRRTMVLVGVLVLVLVGGVVLGGVLAGGSESADPVAGGSSTVPSSRGSTATTTGTPGSAADCSVPAGDPYVGGPSVELSVLGEANGVVVEGAVYPRPEYEGGPWSQWGQGLVLPDGRHLSAIGDHLGRDGNSYLYEYDPSTGVLSMIGDVLSYVDHQPGAWGYGKVHGDIVAGPCGEAYFATYWGSNRDIEYGAGYRGDMLFRIDPDGRTVSSLGVPVEEHGIPSFTGAPGLGLVYGEAIDPILEDQDIDQGPFFVYDVAREEVVFESPATPHAGFRDVIVDADGRAYYAVGAGELAVYDPETGETSIHPHQMPGDWLRASTPAAPDGRVIAVTRDPDTFFVLHPSGEIEALGNPVDYTASIAIDATGDHAYFVPDAHGGTWERGAPLMSLDTHTGEQTLVAELHPIVEPALGLYLGGTFNITMGPSGDVLYIGFNAGTPGSDGFGEVVLLVVHLP